MSHLRICGSCGWEDQETQPVVRVYVLVDDDGSQHLSDAGTEEWCAACRSTYPWREATSPPAGTDPSS